MFVKIDHFLLPFNETDGSIIQSLIRSLISSKALLNPSEPRRAAPKRGQLTRLLTSTTEFDGALISRALLMETVLQEKHFQMNRF